MEIKLSRGLVAIVDDEDYERLNQFRWHANKKGYAMRHLKTGKRNTVFMHREIIGAYPGIFVDHIDGNIFNNQRNNLRLATNAQNCCNSGSRRGSSSSFKGVRLFRDGKWHARIMANYKEIHLGYFKNEIDAAIAYNNAAIIHHGEFAKLNNITL